VTYVVTVTLEWWVRKSVPGQSSSSGGMWLATPLDVKHSCDWICLAREDKKFGAVSTWSSCPTILWDSIPLYPPGALHSAQDTKLNASTLSLVPCTASCADGTLTLWAQFLNLAIACFRSIGFYPVITVALPWAVQAINVRAALKNAGFGFQLDDHKT